MLCLSGFELYSRWVPVNSGKYLLDFYPWLQRFFRNFRCAGDYPTHLLKDIMVLPKTA